MYSLKSIKLYFFSILKLFFINFRNFYFRSSYYNKKLVTFIPERFFYKPSTFLCTSLTSFSNDFYNITETKPELLWKVHPQLRAVCQAVVQACGRREEALKEKVG